MRSNKAIVVMLFALIALFSLGIALAETPDDAARATYVLPSSLTMVEDEAFAGTAVKTVVFPDGLLSIGERAFEGVNSLADVYIPPSTKHIADSAFPVNDELAIHGVRGSYAQRWAKKHKVHFVEDDIWKNLLDNGKPVEVYRTIDILLGSAVDSDKLDHAIPWAKDDVLSRRPQDRPELNPIDYRFP